MSSSHDLNALLEIIMSQLGQEAGHAAKDIPASHKKGCCINKDKKKPPILTPQKVLVILGLLGGVLEVRSILLDRDQVVQILLDGSLKRKTRLEKMLDEIGDMPFDDVLRAVLGRIK